MELGLALMFQREKNEFISKRSQSQEFPRLIASPDSSQRGGQLVLISNPHVCPKENRLLLHAKTSGGIAALERIIGWSVRKRV